MVLMHLRWMRVLCALTVIRPTESKRVGWKTSHIVLITLIVKVLIIAGSLTVLQQITHSPI